MSIFNAFTNVWQNHSTLCTEQAWAHQWKLGQLLWEKEDDRKKTCQQEEKANIIQTTREPSHCFRYGAILVI